jgi:prevent-host-death family protein
MQAISLRDAQTKLAELIQGLAQGEEVLITENNLPVARLARVDSDLLPIVVPSHLALKPQFAIHRHRRKEAGRYFQGRKETQLDC